MPCHRTDYERHNINGDKNNSDNKTQKEETKYCIQKKKTKSPEK